MVSQPDIEVNFGEVTITEHCLGTVTDVHGNILRDCLVGDKGIVLLLQEAGVTGDT